MAKAKTTPKASSTKKSTGALNQHDARAALDRATRKLKTLCRSQYANAWKIGRALLQVGELGLHRARGFASLDAYAAAQLDLARDATFQYMRVADAFSESVVEAFGPERLDRGLRYIAATPEDEKPADVPKLTVRTRDADGAVHEKDFAEATIDEIRVATTAERGGAKKTRKPAERAETIEKANAALDAAVGRAAAKDAEAKIRRDAKGRELLDLRGVPLAKAPAALRAVAKALG